MHPINYIVMGFLRDIFDDVGYIVNGGDYYGQSEKIEDRDWQERMQEKQNDFNLRMWNLNNEYNNPAAQMQRLKDAGLSAGGAAAAINGGQTSGPVVSSQMPNAPDQNSGAIGVQRLATILGGIKQLSLLGAEKENLEADTRVKEADANRNEQTLTYDIEILKNQSDFVRTQINQINKDMELTDEQIKYQQVLNKYADKMEESKLNQINENIKQMQQAVKNMTQEEAKMAWENMYRTEFGIDPHDGALQMIVQASLKGDMDKVFAAFDKTIQTVFSYLKGEKSETIPEKVKETVENEKNGVIDKVDDMFGIRYFNKKTGRVETWKPILAFNRYQRRKQLERDHKNGINLRDNMW